MKKFKFSLQTVHNVRELRLKKEEIALSTLRAEVARAEEHLVATERTRFDALENYSRKLNNREPMSPYEMEMHTRHLLSLNGSISEARARVEETKRCFMQQSKVVASAGQAVKITERLRDTQKKLHRIRAERTEQSDQDEMAAARFARQLRVK